MTSKPEIILRKSQTGEATDNVGQFGTHDHSQPECGLPAPKRRTIEEIDADFDQLAIQEQEAEHRRFDLAAEAIGGIVLDRFPNATRLELEDGNDGPGSPYFIPARIFGDGDNLLWEGDENGDESEFFYELSDYTPSLDRRPNDALSIPGHPNVRGLNFA